MEEQRREAHGQKYRTNVKLQVGDRVLVERPGPFNKMELPWKGPYRVAEALPLDRYRLTSASGFRMHPIFHISKLKKFPNVQLGDEVDDEEFFEIEDIVDVRTGVDGQSLYRVRWKGYGPQFDEWHTIDDLGDEAIIFAQNREAELRARASSSAPPSPGSPVSNSKEPKPKKKKGKARSSGDEPTHNRAEEGSSKESELRQKRAERRAADKEARQVSTVEFTPHISWDPTCEVRASKVCFVTDSGLHYAWRRRGRRGLGSFDYPGGTAEESESPSDTLLREVGEEISLPSPRRRSHGLEDALRRAVETHPLGMARQVLRHPTTSVLHDVRVWAVRGSAPDLFNIRPKLEGLVEGDAHGLHHESDVMVGPYAVLYADAVREAIRALPPPPPQTDPVPTGLPADALTRRRWRVQPSPSLKNKARSKSVVCEGGVVRFLHKRA